MAGHVGARLTFGAHIPESKEGSGCELPTFRKLTNEID